MIAAIALSVAATAVAVAPTPASVAAWVMQTEAPAADATASAIDSGDPLVRATAARVIATRNWAVAIPALRDRLAREDDPNAAREEVRALVLAGQPVDVDFAIESTRRLPRGIDQVLARAVSRRSDAIDLLPKLRAIHVDPDSAFMVQAFWSNAPGAVAAGARFAGAADAIAWRALLEAMRDSGLAMEPNVIAASLNSPSEPIRVECVWYLVHGYALEPARLPAAIVAALRDPKEEASLRELFGRELLSRMLGAAPKEDPRFLTWLVSPEADAVIGPENALFTYFTDDEFLTRKRHCDIASSECRVPATRKTTYPSKPVTPAAFQLPDLLPPGLAVAIVRDGKCTDGWLAVASATADHAGRVQKTSLQQASIDRRCTAVVNELLRLSFATPTSIASPLSTDNILLVQAPRSAPCLDEAPLGEGDDAIHSVTADVRAPVVTHREEPVFPASARRAMGGGVVVAIVAQCVISRTGCVRSIRLLTQSQFPDLNAAVVQAIAKWQFTPGELNGRPVDVVFNLTVQFRTGY